MVVEVFTFRLRPDVSESQFLDADAAVQTQFYYQQRGMARRTTAKGPDGEWVSVVFWGSEDDVVTPDESFMSLITDVRTSVYNSLD